MTDQLHLQPDDDADLQAAEYVLGVMPREVRAAFETRLKQAPSLALAVAQWEERLSGLNESYAEEEPPNLLPQLEARLFGKVDQARPAFWKGWLGGALAAMALVVSMLAFLPAPPPQGFAPLVTLTAEAQDLRYEVLRKGDTLRITRIAGAAAEPGRVHELWLIAGAAAPVSLGLIAVDEVELTVPGLGPGMILAISLEPAGGSPTGAPTGAVLVTGVVERI